MKSWGVWATLFDTPNYRMQHIRRKKHRSRLLASSLHHPSHIHHAKQPPPGQAPVTEAVAPGREPATWSLASSGRLCHAGRFNIHIPFRADWKHEPTTGRLPRGTCCSVNICRVHKSRGQSRTQREAKSQTCRQTMRMEPHKYSYTVALDGRQ